MKITKAQRAQIEREYAKETGRRGGKARAAKLTRGERSEIARKAALARWSAHTPKTESTERDL